MSGLGFVGRVLGVGASTVFKVVWTFLGPVVAAVVAILTEIISTLSCVTFGACVGVIIGATAVKHWRRYLARKDKKAAKKAAAEEAARAKKLSAGSTTLAGFHAGQPPARPIPPDVVALALLHLPKWAKEAEVSRVAWFNKVLDYMWPHVDTAVCEMVRDKVEPVLRTSAPPLVSWVGFEKLTLGPTPGTLGGVKVYGSHSEEAMMEMEFSWAGGLDVVVAAYVFGVRIPVRIHDLQFRSYLRVTITPLVDELPCLGGLEVSLMDLPEHVDFGVTIPPGVDLMALPGAQRALRFAMWKALGPKMVYPAKMHMPIMANSGMEQQSTGMIKVTVLSGINFSSRWDLARSEEKSAGSRKGFMLFKADRYLVRMNTRKTRSVMLKDKSTDDPTWNETHYFLTGADSVFTAVLFSVGMKEFGRCELPLVQIATEENAGKVIRVELHIEDGSALTKEHPAPREAPPNATPEELKDIRDEHESLLRQHAVELATTRAGRLRRAMAGKPREGVPSISCEIEYMSFASKGEHGGGAGGGRARTGAGEKDDDAAAATEAGTGTERRGILTFFLTRAIQLNDLSSSRSKPKPAATVSCAGQTYTTKSMKEKTNKPLWHETFIFFNVSASDKVQIRVTDSDAKGEFLGEASVDVAEVAKNVELQDSWVLSGIKTNAKVTGRLKFTYMIS